MAGGSGSFFKNCKSEKVGEDVRGNQEGSTLCLHRVIIVKKL